MEPRPTSIEIRLLGPVELRVDGRDVPLGGPRQRALLALLAMRSGQVVPAGELIEELWGGEPSDGAETTLRSYVSRLRRSLGEAGQVERTDRGYQLKVQPSAVDALEFERLTSEGAEALARSAPRRARDRLVTGLDLWRGRAFGDLGMEGLLGATARRLDELRLLAVERRIEADLDLGRGDGVIEELEELVAEHPFRERLWRHLMLAMYRAGRQADALAAYHRARQVLDEQLGIEPGPELRDLEGAILRQDLPEVARADATNNIPQAITSFIGRAQELEDVQRLVREHRLVTLTGVGGVGKTRLALEVARRHGDAYPDGAWFVDLAPLADPGLVAPTLAATLGIREQPGTPVVEGLLGQLGDRELLVVLDNCEHIRDAAAATAAAVLARAPGSRILATSRVSLGVAGEADFAVPPLGITADPADRDDAGTPTPADAIELFVARARAARPSLPATLATLDAVGRIVADLDGLPLAIELAAARAKALTINDIAAGLNDRFRFLVSWRPLASARHRTLAAAMAWSFDLLDAEEQALLAHLSVFAGSFDLDAVAGVCLDADAVRALDLVERLVDASLVLLDAVPDGRSRYRLLETVRQYASERLAESGRADAARTAHATYFAALAESTPRRGSEAGPGMARLDLELDNLRAAMDAAEELGQQSLQRRLAAGLWHYWHVRGYLAEGLARLAATHAHGPDVAIGPEVAPERYEEVLLGAGNMAWQLGRYEEGKRYGRELLERAEAGGSVGVAHAGNRVLAAIALRERDFATSNRHSLEAVRLARQMPDPLHGLTTELNHAVMLMDWGRVRPAVTMFEEILGRFRDAGHREGEGLALLNLGEAAFLLGDDAEARARFGEARDVFDAVGFRAHVGHAIQGLAAVEARRGKAAAAARLLGQADAVLSAVGASRDDFNPAMVAEAVASAREALGEQAYASAFAAGWDEGRTRSSG